MNNPASQGIMLENDFSSNVISERARLFCSSAMRQLRFELLARGLPARRAGTVIILMGEVLQLCKTWINERISLQGLQARPVDLDDLIGTSLSCCCRISPE